ncbi:hypothetical protein BGW36DRAFT_263037, partial [Talaromyces proteolyticus]
MYTSALLLLGASSCAFAAPTWTDVVSRTVSTIHTRDSGDSDKSNGITIAGIVIGVVFAVIIAGVLVMYLFSSDNCITRRGWYQSLRQRKKSKVQSQHLSPFDDDQEALTKRASFQSERESIMFSRSRASSLQFAVVEETDQSQRRSSQQIYVLRGDTYVPMHQVDTINTEQPRPAIERRRESQTDDNISPIDDQASSHPSIPVVVTPPLES